MGYGDVKALNPQGKIATPSLDRLASEGIAFTDAHSSSAVCTPSRYSILTGRYNWRSRLKSGVLSGNSPPLIEPGRLTVAEMLREHGYSTACIGKWHLGLEWSRGGTSARRTNVLWQIDYAQPVQGGPLSAGFDSFFGIAASLDMPPFIYIQNERCVGTPTVEKTWVRKGPAEKDFEAVDVLPAFTRKAVEYIDGRAGEARKGQPFFLYLALSSPHTPIVPSAEWRGKSGINDYADIGETNNVQAQHPEIVERLTRLLESYVQRGRSTPGAAQREKPRPPPGKTATSPAVSHPAKADLINTGALARCWADGGRFQPFQQLPCEGDKLLNA